MSSPIRSFVEGVVRIKDKALRDTVVELLEDALKRRPDGERRLIMERLEKVGSCNLSYDPPAWVKQKGDKFIMTINRPGFYDETGLSYKRMLRIIQHELDEIISFIKGGVSVHELMFLLDEMPSEVHATCTICGQEVRKGYIVTSEEGWFFSLSSFLPLEEKEEGSDFVCKDCMWKTCPYYVDIHTVKILYQTPSGQANHRQSKIEDVAIYQTEDNYIGTQLMSNFFVNQQQERIYR
ncbi:MAG: hypothetical protein NXY59_10165 [Aigarchaeota archaeon]|nr:hypothetical protein [Candidatus Pelearchaeum maunauluense]